MSDKKPEQAGPWYGHHRWYANGPTAAVLCRKTDRADEWQWATYTPRGLRPLARGVCGTKEEAKAAADASLREHGHLEGLVSDEKPEQVGPWRMFPLTGSSLRTYDDSHSHGNTAAYVKLVDDGTWWWETSQPDMRLYARGPAATREEAMAAADAVLRERGHLPPILAPAPEPAPKPEPAPAPVPKPRWSLLPWVAVAEVVALYTRAAQGKHATEHWRSMTVDEHLDAVQRHIVAHRTGDTTDPEYGFMHLVHAAARLLYAVAVATKSHNPPAESAGTGA